jgi:hypothetical protein
MPIPGLSCEPGVQAVPLRTLHDDRLHVARLRPVHFAVCCVAKSLADSTDADRFHGIRTLDGDHYIVHLCEPTRTCAS